ncbi:MAG TPA: hypothetical protein VN030_14190 [Cellvibrio sp.]|nr:hypothetical protein [Cellvibrio sp.]
MKKTYLLFAAFIFIQGCATTPLPAQQSEAGIKGSKLPPYPGNSELYQSACIGSTKADSKNTEEKLCDFSIKVFKEKNAGSFILAATAATGNKLNGQPEWVVLDALALTKIKENSLIEIFTCRYKGVADDTIIALIPEHTGNTSSFIKAGDWAYRINLPSGQFVALEPDLVDCENTAVGVD